MIQALQHTSEQIYIHTWASANNTRVLCSSLLDRCPYGGTRRASAHMHYKNPLQLIFGPVSIYGGTRRASAHMHYKNPLQLSCMWTGVHMVAHDGPVPTCITRILCSSVACGPVSIWWHTTGQCPHALQESFAAQLHVDRCPYGGTRRASAHITRILRSSFLDWCPYGGTRRASAHITRILRSSFLDRCPYGGTSVPVPK